MFLHLQELVVYSIAAGVELTIYSTCPIVKNEQFGSMIRVRNTDCYTEEEKKVYTRVYTPELTVWFLY